MLVMMKHDDLYHLIWLSRPLMQAAEACVEQALVGSGLTVRMRAVLEILYSDGDATVPDIAARLDIKRQYVQLMVNETQHAGLTQSHPNPRHKRSPLITLTDTGRLLIESVMAKEQTLLDEIGADLDPDATRTALQTVRTLITRLKQTTGSTT
jgi:DNA-binding MarR family transcriptional regulator